MHLHEAVNKMDPNWPSNMAPHAKRIWRTGHVTWVMLLFGLALTRSMPMQLNCSNLDGKMKCVERDGCAWCIAQTAGRDGEEGVSDSNICVEWQHCIGPPNSCELNRNQSSCVSPMLGFFMGAGKGSRDDALRRDALLETCSWCKVEQRCVEAGQG